MARMLVAFFALAMLCALVPANGQEDHGSSPYDNMMKIAPLTLPLPGESTLSRAARSPDNAPKKCGDKLCVTACVKEAGVYKCL